MTEYQVAKLTIESFSGLMNSLPTRSDKSDAMACLMMACCKLLRTIEGDEFVRVWMESALRDLAENPPVFVAVTAH